jgi:hypothetical protein
MKSFYEFYRLIKENKLFEQEMGDPMTANATGGTPPMQGGVAPPAMPAAAPAAAPAVAGAEAMPEEPEAGSEEDKSNVSPSAGELDTESVAQALESLAGMADNFKSQDEDKGAQYEQLVNQLKDLVASITGTEDEEKEEGEEEAPPQGAEGQNPIPAGGAAESGEGGPELGGQAGMPTAPGAGTMQGGEAMMNAMGGAPAAPMA